MSIGVFCQDVSARCLANLLAVTGTYMLEMVRHFLGITAFIL